MMTYFAVTSTDFCHRGSSNILVKLSKPIHFGVLKRL